MTQERKYCPEHKTFLPITYFKLRKSGKYRTYCIDCERKKNRNYRKKEPKFKGKLYPNSKLTLEALTTILKYNKLEKSNSVISIIVENDHGIKVSRITVGRVINGLAYKKEVEKIKK